MDVLHILLHLILFVLGFVLGALASWRFFQAQLYRAVYGDKTDGP